MGEDSVFSFLTSFVTGQFLRPLLAPLSILHSLISFCVTSPLSSSVHAQDNTGSARLAAAEKKEETAVTQRYRGRRCERRRPRSGRIHRRRYPRLGRQRLLPLRERDVVVIGTWWLIHSPNAEP